ncbi:MAG: AMP-binding protein, partial [Gaiellales bacterium]
MSPEVSAETLRACIDRQGDAPALVVAEDSGTTAYRELGARVDELAGQLSAVGVARGATVALVLPNGPEFVEVLLAISTLGAIAAPLNPAYTRDEHRFYLDDLRPAVLVLAVGETPAAREACSAATRIVEAVIDQKAGLGLSADGEPVEAVTGYDIAAPDDIALLLHTSGTTSRPKQVPLTHRNLLASARTIAAFYELTPSDVSFCVMPLFHVHGLVASTLAPLVSGGTVVVARRLAPRRFWGQLEQRGVTWLSAGPTLHHMLVERADPDRARLVRFARSCSSALSAELFARCEEAYGAP